MVSRWKRSLCSLVLLFGLIGQASAELGIEFGIEDFRWREFEAGTRLLKESGTRHRLGASWRQALSFDQRDSLLVRGALYFGGVDYDGQACDTSQNCVPFQTDTDYVGLAGEATFARRFGARGNGELFVGGGIDSWERDVKGHSGVSGAIENWTVFYALAGGGAHWQRHGARFHAQIGAKFPFYTHEIVDSFDVTLQPKGRLSAFARLSTDFLSAGRPRWGLGVYYDSYHFAMSDVERVGSLLLWQPESKQDVVGVYATVYLN